MNLKHEKTEIWIRLKGQGVGAILARGAGSSFAVMMLGTALAFITNIVLARLMGATQYGIYIYALTWVTLLSMVCKLGMDTSLLRFIPAYNARKEWGLMRGILGRSLLIVLFVSISAGFTAAVVVWLLGNQINENQRLTFWISFLLLPLFAITGLRSTALRALKQIVKAGLPDSLFQRLIVIMLAGIGYLYLQQNLTATYVMLANFLGALIAFSIGTVWLINALPKELQTIKPKYATKEWLTVSLPMFFISGMHLILHQTDIIMVGIILDTKQAGIYAVATRIAGLMAFGLSAVNAIAAPMISELYSTGRYQELQRMITLAARAIFAFTLIAGVILVFAGKYALSLFGLEFVVGYYSLLILLIGQTVNAVSGSVGFLMTMTGRHSQAAKILGVSALINIVLNAMLIWRFGMIGAAISTALTTALWNLSMLYYVWKRMQFNPTVFARIP